MHESMSRWIFLVGCLYAGTLVAGAFNPKLSIGDPAPSWQALPATDGRSYSTADFAARQVLVLVFTCNSCPYAVDCEDRLNALTKRYSGNDSQVAVVAVNVNTTPTDSFEAMKERATAKSFGFPYLYDATQQIAIDFGATRTPEFFVLDAERRVVYMGALDDSPDGKQVKNKHVEQAIEAALREELPSLKETPPVGCRIRMLPKRSGR